MNENQHVIQYNSNTTRRCRTKKYIAQSWSNQVNEPEGWVHQVWPNWVQYTALFCTWVLYSFYYMPVFIQFGSVLGACNTTENIEQCYRPMKTLDFTSVCNKWSFHLLLQRTIKWETNINMHLYVHLNIYLLLYFTKNNLIRKYC